MKWMKVMIQVSYFNSWTAKLALLVVCVFFSSESILAQSAKVIVAKDGTGEVSLEDLDEALFAGLMNVTQRSVKRKELFKRINERLEQSFLVIERSDSDKRRKIIVFKWDILI